VGAVELQEIILLAVLAAVRAQLSLLPTIMRIRGQIYLDKLAQELAQRALPIPSPAGLAYLAAGERALVAVQSPLLEGALVLLPVRLAVRAQREAVIKAAGALHGVMAVMGVLRLLRIQAVVAVVLLRAAQVIALFNGGSKSWKTKLRVSKTAW
jgi:hypothetical protein